MEPEKKMGRPPKEETFVQVTVMVTEELRDKIDAKAGAAKRSRSDWLRLLLEKHVS